jgi:hypothetical protein
MVCALAAAAAFAVAVQGSPWWRIGDEIGIGTMTTRHCFGEGGCSQSGLSWTGGSDTWVKAGAATYGAGLVAALILLALAGALAAKASGRLAAMSAGVATLSAAVVGTVFVVTRPAVPGTELARGVPLFAIGFVLAAVAVVSTLRRRRP